jgi:hypothetical protein
MGHHCLGEAFVGDRGFFAAEHVGQGVFEREDFQAVDCFYVVGIPGAAVDGQAAAAEAAAFVRQQDVHGCGISRGAAVQVDCCVAGEDRVGACDTQGFCGSGDQVV